MLGRCRGRLQLCIASGSLPTMGKTITYTHTRLAFIRDEIEPLEVFDTIRIESNMGVFELTKAQFIATFPNVRQSFSYTHNGCYHYPTLPGKARQFLVGAAKPSSAKKPNEQDHPPFLSHIDKAVYLRWLNRKAIAHVIRDKKRGNENASRAEYKAAIHAAVVNSGGVDAYTGQPLDWTLLSKYNNEESESGRRTYKKQFANLPTVDHVDDGLGAPDFRICSWRINDSKHDLTLDEFIEVCKAVLDYQGKNHAG